MAKVITLFNQSVGVRKTTLCQNLGYQLVTRGARVLLLDLDPQASLMSLIGPDVTELTETIYEALISEEIHPLKMYSDLYQMDLAPANITLANAEQELILVEQRELRLEQALSPLIGNYDFVLIGCPPSLGILSQISLVAAEYGMPLSISPKKQRSILDIFDEIAAAMEAL
jgi:chromosome partitioning protein